MQPKKVLNVTSGHLKENVLSQSKVQGLTFLIINKSKINKFLSLKKKKKLQITK